MLSETNAPFVSKDHLRAAKRVAGDEALTQPPLAFLRDELGAFLEPWLAQDDPDDRLRLIVLPPCDHSDLLGEWARASGHDTVEEPTRSLLDHSLEIDFSFISADERSDVVVIPQLERWFLRSDGGLDVVSRLLEKLDASNRKCVVGCNSWAWRYLSAVVSATSVLPPGITFEAIDGATLRAWFQQIEPRQNIRLAANGAQLLSDQEQDKPRVDNYFQELAAHSLGIPWVAWYAWRRSFRSRTDIEEDPGGQADSDSEQGVQEGLPQASGSNEPATIWLAELSKLRLPNPISIRHLFVLQALLIHGSLTDDEINAVCPDENHTGAAIALRRANVIERVNGRLRCSAVAFPMVRAALADAGFPLDSL